MDSGLMECSRREFARWGAGMALLSLAGGAPKAGAAAGTAKSLYRWCPRFPIARELWVVPFAGNVEDGMVLESAAGLAARAALRGSWRAFLYEDVDNDGYKRWFEAYCRTHRPRLLRMNLDEAVQRLLKAGIVQGYLLYRFDASDRPLHSPGPLDESANVATSLAGAHGGVVVSEGLVARMENLGLVRLADVRSRTENGCLQDTGNRFTRDLIGTADPKTRNVRSLMVALDAFVCSGRGDAYREGLARCRPDVPVVGWGCEGEDAQTIPSSRWGLYQTATNWCHNLPVFAGEVAGASIPTGQLRHRHLLRWSDLDWGDGRHYASMVMSDGDNVQWMMGNFTGGPEAPSYFGHPERGRIPFGWGVPAPSLAQLSPRTLAEILTRATRNDDFILYSGGGYFYPDLYGQARGGTEALRLHGERLRGYMDLTGIRVLAFNFQDWDSAQALAACGIMASRMPGLLGILAFQYYPYSAGEGAIRWVRGAGGDRVPIVSCRLCVWAQTGRPRDTTPAGVAAWLNRQPVVEPRSSEDAFSWVIVHAWSRFRRAEPGAPVNAEEAGVSQDRDAPGTARGYTPALWTAERLSSRVKAVTPQELLWRVRLRLRPQATLERCLRETRERARSAREPKAARDMLREAAALLPQVGSDDRSARRCFEQLREADRLLRKG